MNWESIQLAITVLLTVTVFVAFLKEWAAPDVIALGALAVVVAIGAVSGDQLLALFSNSAPITIGAMFILSAALERTGVMDSLARGFTKVAGRSLVRALGLLALIVIPLSAVSNNTPVVVVFLPMLMAYSRETGVPASKLLIPLSFLAILGGTTTIIGTSTNILVSGLATDMGQPAFGIFEITKMGVLYAVFGAAYLLVFGPRLLPDRPTLSALLSSKDTRSFCSQAVVKEGSSLDGKTLPETSFGKSLTVRVFEVIRDGLRVSDTPIDLLVLRGRDVLVLKGSARDVAAIQEAGDLSFTEKGEGTPAREVRLVEAIIGPHSRMLAHKIRDLRLRRRYGVVAAALHRRGQNLLDNFLDIPLEFGDTILFEGPEANLARLREEDDFLSLNETVERPFRKRLAPLAVGALAFVMIFSATGILPIVSAAIIAAVVVVLARCLDPSEAYESIDWPILFLIVGMLGLGKSLETTGAASLVAGHIAAMIGPMGPVFLLAATYLIATILTEMVTNNAVAIILTPIAINMASAAHLDSRPFLVAVMFAASASFCSPIGYQTNTYVFGAGGYKFSDFAKIGIPLNLLLFATAVTLIPIFWPFTK